MGSREDLIQRLRNGGERKLVRPATSQAVGPRNSIEPRYDPDRFGSPVVGGASSATPFRSRATDDISRPATQQAARGDPFHHPNHLTPPLSSSPPSGRRLINFYEPDRTQPAPISFTEFSVDNRHIPATPVHQISSNLGRDERQPDKSNYSHEVLEADHILQFDPEAASQIPSPPLEHGTVLHGETLVQSDEFLPAAETTSAHFHQPRGSEDEYADDDQWFETALAEVDLDRIQSRFSCGSSSHDAPLQAARPAPDRAVTRSPYFPVNPQATPTQQLGQLRSSSRLSNTSSSVTFPKRPGSGLQMRPSTVTPPLLKPTPRKAGVHGQRGRSAQALQPADTDGLVPISELGMWTAEPLSDLQIHTKRLSCFRSSTSTGCRALCLRPLIALMRTSSCLVGIIPVKTSLTISAYWIREDNRLRACFPPHALCSMLGTTAGHLHGSDKSTLRRARQ